MRVEGNARPVQPFSIEVDGDAALVRFRENVEQVDRVDEDGQTTTVWAWDEYILRVPAREGLAGQIEAGFDAWLGLAKAEAAEPAPESEREKVARLDRDARLLGVELSEREISEIIMGRQISGLEIALLEIQMGGA